MSLGSVARTAGRAAFAVGLTQVAAYGTSKAAGRANVVDAFWGPGFAAVALDGALRRRSWTATATAAVITGWAARLSWHTATVSKGRGEDPRYAEMLKDSNELQRIVKVFVTQGAAQWFVSLPLQAIAGSASPVGRAGRAVAVTGLTAMVAGAAVEATADAQKSAFKAAGNTGVMDQGLWSWSRHPNYFGDSVLWWGAYAVAATHRGGVWTWPAPALMTTFLVKITGAARAERMRADDPEFQDYTRRVSYFIPLPPSAVAKPGGTP